MEHLRGILLMTVAMAAFALADMFIKLASASLPTGQITLVLGLGGALMFGAICRHQGTAIISKAFLHPKVIGRNMCEVLGTVSMVTALAVSPISTVSAILQALPLLITLGAALFLGETVGWRRWSAILVGLIGVLIIIRPGMEGFEITSLLAVAAVIGLSGRDLVTRSVPRRISTPLLATYAFASMVPTGALMLAFTGGANMPDPTVSALLVAMILFGVLGYFAITAAMRQGEISALAPFRYSRILFAMVIGLLIFGERPDQMTLLGASLIVLSGIYTLMREKGLKQPQIVLPNS